MRSSYTVFPPVSLVVDGRPRRATSHSVEVPALEHAVAIQPERAQRRLRAWPIFLGAIALGVLVGVLTKPADAHHKARTSAAHALVNSLK